jgi:hypothetical protein
VQGLDYINSQFGNNALSVQIVSRPTRGVFTPKFLTGLDKLEHARADRREQHVARHVHGRRAM